MSFSPQLHLKAYRVDAANNQIIFAVSGSSVNVVSSVSLGSPPSRGSYTSVPSVSATGGGGSGFLATARMRVKTISITPSVIPVSYYDDLLDFLNLTISSSLGSGATLTPGFGIPNIGYSGPIYFNPTSASPPNHVLTYGGGAGGAYALSYSVARMTVEASSPPSGLYSAKPTVAINGISDGLEPLFGFESISHSSGVFEIDWPNACQPEIASIIVDNGGQGVGAAFTHAYRPRMFTGTGTMPKWTVSDPKPTFGVNPSFTPTGSGASLTGHYGIDQLALTNAGTGYSGTYEFYIQAGSPPTTIVTGQISDDGSGGLDLGSIFLPNGSIEAFYPGYFSDTPNIVIESGGNDDAVLEVQSMRLLRIEASGGSGYTSSDLLGFSNANRLIENTSPPSLTERNVDDWARLQYATVQSSSIATQGSQYDWGSILNWQGPNFVTLSDGVPTESAKPVITSTQRLTNVRVDYSPSSYTTASTPTITVTAPPSGTTPVVKIASANLEGVTATSRGSGYPMPTSIYDLTHSGFFSDADLLQGFGQETYPFYIVGVYLNSATISNPGIDYVGGDSITVSPPSLTGAAVGSVTQIEIDSIAITSGGSGYTSAPTISFTGGNGSPGASATATISSITPELSSFPLVTASDVDLGSPSTGDARKLAYAIADCFFNIFSGNLSFRVTAQRELGSIAGGSGANALDRVFTYRFKFNVEKSGDYALRNE